MIYIYFFLIFDKKKVLHKFMADFRYIKSRQVEKHCIKLWVFFKKLGNEEQQEFLAKYKYMKDIR